MTIEEQQFLRENRMENSRYQGHDTFGRSMFNNLVANPLIDSAVINSSAKGNSATFMNAIDTGIYRNNTILGGNSLFGNETMLDSIPFIGEKMKDMRASWKEGKLGSFFGDRYSIQRVGNKVQSAVGSESYLSKVGIKDADHILESGYGFSKNYSDFFELLREQGFNNVKAEARALDERNIQFKRKGTDAKGNARYKIKTFDNEKIFVDNFTGTENINAVKNGKGMAQRGIFGNADFENIFKGKSTEEAVEMFDKHFSGQSIEELQKTRTSLEKLGIRFSKTYTPGQIERATNLKNAAESGNVTSLIKEINKKDAKTVKKIAREMGYKNGNIKYSEEIFEKIGQSKTLQKLMSVADGNVISKEALSKEISEKVVEKFVTKTGFEKIMSNSFVQFATGNVIAGAAGFGVNIAGAIIGGMANAHGEASIQNFSNMMVYNEIKGEEIVSENALKSQYGHDGLSRSNDMDLYNILSSDNLADRYRKDVTPIEIDNKGGKLEDFLVY